MKRKRATRPERHRYITRLESSWWVRIYPGNPKRQIQRAFSDSKHGGYRKAERAAMAFRDRHAPRIQPRVVHVRRRRNKRTKLPIGVTYTRYQQKVGKYRYWREEFSAYYQRRTTIQSRRSFNIRTLGRKRALRMALKFRRTGVSRIGRAA